MISFTLGSERVQLQKTDLLIIIIINNNREVQKIFKDAEDARFLALKPVKLE